MSNGITAKEYEAACSIAGLINLSTAVGMKRGCNYYSDIPERKVIKMVQGDSAPKLSTDVGQSDTLKDWSTSSELATQKASKVIPKDMTNDDVASAKVMSIKSVASGATFTPGLEYESVKKSPPVLSHDAEPDLKPASSVDRSQKMDTGPPALLAESGWILSCPAIMHAPELKVAKIVQKGSMPLFYSHAADAHARQHVSPEDRPNSPEKYTEHHSKDVIDDAVAPAKMASSVTSGANSTPGPYPDNKKGSQPFSSQDAEPELKPAPFFYYVDHSQEKDTNPPTLLAESGRIPSFPVKMHAILSKPNLKHIVAWDDHGRSFKILDQQQFEQHILPKYFQQSKIASFYRLINGWNFRRIQSNDNPNFNSYYEEHFLRNMPWLCKKMKRPKIGKKFYIQMGKLGQVEFFFSQIIIKLTPLPHFLDHEPNLVAISSKFPLPHFPVKREILFVAEMIELGPRIKMPQRNSLETDPSTAITRVTCMDSKPAALPTPIQNVDIYGRLRNQHPSIMDFNPTTTAAIHTGNASTVTQANEFKDAIATATDNMIRVGMINHYQNRELVTKFRREVKSSLVFEQLLNYHGGIRAAVQAQGMNLTQENIDKMIMQTLDQNHFFHIRGSL